MRKICARIKSTTLCAQNLPPGKITTQLCAKYAAYQNHNTAKICCISKSQRAYAQKLPRIKITALCAQNMPRIKIKVISNIVNR
jgi:hypothetical protein